jgi:hypothetical protein
MCKAGFYFGLLGGIDSGIKIGINDNCNSYEQ